jgi:uncharacterized protein
VGPFTYFFKIKMPLSDLVGFYGGFFLEENRRLAKPDISVSSIYKVPFEEFKDKHLISDWDGVWVPHLANLNANSQACQLLKEIIPYFRSISILSNCSKAREIEVKKQLEGKGMNFFRAEPKKPDPRAFAAVYAALGLPPDTTKITLFIGDRLYSDVRGARNAGIKTIIKVGPIGKEPAELKLARTVENILYRDLVQ